MIADLDSALREMLAREMRDIDIRFEVPDDQFDPTLPAANLFLYDVRENVELRSNEWQTKRDALGIVSHTPPPVRIDCSYLITAWAGDVASEHHLLSEIMKTLLRHPTIPADMLTGSIKEQTPPLPAVTLQAGRLQSMGEFWQALGGKPKAALHYTVTFSIDVFKQVDVPVVRKTAITIKPKT